MNENTPLFAVLGPLRIHRAGETVEVTGALRRNLLATLLLNANESVSVDSLLEMLWRESRSPETLRRLQVLTHRVRALLDDPDRLSAEGGGYRLRVGTEELDSRLFCALLDQAGAHAHEPDRCARLIREAIRLWRGAPFEGIDLPDLAAEVERLSERRLAALEQLFAVELRAGRPQVVIDELPALLHHYPLRERLHEFLITGLYHAGRRGDALGAYRNARTVLIDELGLEPGPDLRRLEEQILAGTEIEAQSPAEAATVPRQLPHDIWGFSGRGDELVRLDCFAADPDAARICAVVGGGGVGKTALVVRWAHQILESFPDGQIFIDLQGYGSGRPVAAGDALATALRALGVEGQAVPTALAERAALFRTLVARKRLLIILDNAAGTDQVRPLLPGGPDAFVAITSRDSLAGLAAWDGAKRIELAPMTAAESESLLRTLLSDHYAAEPDAAVDLARRCAHLPLALRIAAARVGAHPGYRIRDLVADLTERSLDMLDIAGEPQMSVRAVFESSYRLLEPTSALLFRMIGLHPGSDVDAYSGAALIGSDDPRAIGYRLEQLERAKLVEQRTSRRYRMHDLLRAYAVELAETMDSVAERTAALDRLFGYYLRTAASAAVRIDALDEAIGTESTSVTPVFDTHVAALEWLDLERESMIRAALLAGATHFRRSPASGESDPGRYTVGLSRALGWYLDFGWYLDDAWALHTAAVDVARDLGDLIGQGMASRHLAMLRARRDEHTEALHDMEAAAAMIAVSGDIVAEAAMLGSLGMLHAHNGRTTQAVDHLWRCVEIYRSVGYRSRTHWPLAHLGLLLLGQGWSDRAADCLHESLTLAEEHHSLPSSAHALYGLASLYCTLARYEHALHYGHRAVAMARASRMRLLEGVALYHVSTVYRAMGNEDQASRCQDDSLTILRFLRTDR